METEQKAVISLHKPDIKEKSSCFILKLVLVLVHTCSNRFDCHLSSGVVSLPANLRNHSRVALTRTKPHRSDLSAYTDMRLGCLDFIGSVQVPKSINPVYFVYKISDALGNQRRPALSFEHFFSDKS
jgi:hypothetical protein